MRSILIMYFEFNLNLAGYRVRATLWHDWAGSTEVIPQSYKNRGESVLAPCFTE